MAYDNWWSREQGEASVRLRGFLEASEPTAWLSWLLRCLAAWPGFCFWAIFPCCCRQAEKEQIGPGSGFSAGNQSIIPSLPTSHPSNHPSIRQPKRDAPPPFPHSPLASPGFYGVLAASGIQTAHDAVDMGSSIW